MSAPRLSLQATAIRDALARLQLIGSTEEVAKEASIPEGVAEAALEELEAVGDVARTERGLWFIRRRHLGGSASDGDPESRKHAKPRT